MYPEDCHCVWLTPLHKILSCMIYTLFNWSWKSGGIRTHKASEHCMSCRYMFHWSNWSSPPNECAVPALVSFFYGSCVLSCENTFCPAARLHPKKKHSPQCTTWCSAPPSLCVRRNQFTARASARRSGRVI